jgi:hypothetical protein
MLQATVYQPEEPGQFPAILDVHGERGLVPRESGVGRSEVPLLDGARTRGVTIYHNVEDWTRWTIA